MSVKNIHYSQLKELLSDKVKEKQLTQEEIADWCGVNQAAVSKWLCGYARPQPAHLAILIIRLDLDLKEVAAVANYEQDDILRFLQDPCVVPYDLGYAEELLRQLSDAIGQSNSALAIQKVKNLEYWLERSLHLVKGPFHNLPPFKADLVSQRAEEERVLKELDARWPVVAIVGPPGGSKTTLAIQVGWQCLASNRSRLHIPFDAVIWLSAKDRPEQKRWLNDVLDIVARVLNYPYIRNLSVTEKRSHIRNRLRVYRTLIIIDNFETIDDPELEEWIQNVPEPSKVLITSLPGRLPTAKLVPLHGLGQAGSYEFFHQRVQHLQLRDAGRAISTIEHSLVKITAGNPKIMEVALGTVKYEQLSMNEIVNLLQPARQAADQFEILLPIAWTALSASIGRGSEVIHASELRDAQRVLLVMPFFVDTVSKEALSAAADVEGEQLERALTQLVEMGLLDAYGPPESATPRFGIHPVVRAFASRKLAEMPAFEAQARSGWYGYFLRYVEDYGDDDLGEAIGRGIAGHREKLDAEMTNIRATIEWCFQHRPEKAVRLVERITTYLLDEGLWRDRLELSQRAHDIAKTREMRVSQVGLLARIGWTELVKGKWDEAEKTYKQAIALAREYNVSDRLVQSLRDLGHLFALRGNLARENELDESVKLFAKADQLIAESFALAEETGDELGEREARAFAARVAYMYGDLAHLQKAKREFRTLLDQCQTFCHWRHILFIQRYLAQIAMKEGDPSSAQQYLQRADETLKQRYYEAHDEAQNMECQGDLFAAQVDQDQARTTYKKALDLTIRLGMKKEETRIRSKLRSLDITQ